MTLTDHSWSHPVHHHASSSSSSSGASGSSNTTSPMMMMESSSLDSHCSSPGQTSLTMDNCSIMDHHATSHHSFVHHHHLLSSARPNGDISYPSSSSTDSSCYFSSSEFGMIGFLERKPYRPFRSNQEYLIAMKEDLAEWLNTMYGLHLTCENFLQQLETGVILCQHANSVLRKVNEWRLMNCIDGGGAPASIVTAANAILERRELVPIKLNAAPGTFQARDNIANFIDWCKRIQIHECLLFETEDLVGRKNEKSFILCLLEVARYGAKFGVLAPTLVQFEQEIDQEIEIDNQKAKQANHVDYEDCSTFENAKQNGYHSNDVDNDEPKQQITNNDLESLHEKVVNLLSRCTCPVQFYLEHLSEGKYRIGDTRTLIFVRILRNHVMVRVGGGWDTLEHYLEKHDPCRCRFGHRYTNTARVVVPPAGANKSATSAPGQPLTMQVTIDRPAPVKLLNSVSCSSPVSPPWRQISGKQPPSLQSTPGHVVSYNGHVNHSRRASTSSNDSQNTSSSCSVPDSISSGTSNASSLPLTSSIIAPELDNHNYHRQSVSQPKKQNHRQMANSTMQSTNFTVLPDRNNNIKGLSTNGQRQSTGSKSHYSQPNKANIAAGNVNQVVQINGHKRRPSLAETAANYGSSSPSPNSTVSSSSSSSSLVTGSRIPKSRSAIVNALVATPGNGTNHHQQSRFTNNKPLLSSAYKAKSTSVCSLAAAVVSGSSGTSLINGNGGSKIPSLSNADRKKLLNHYGLPLTHGYSSHSIYLDCNSRQSIGTGNGQQNAGPVPKTSATYNKSNAPTALKIKHKHNRYDKQKLNKSTIDLISSGLLNENGAAMPKQRPHVSNGPRSINTAMINNAERNSTNLSSLSLMNISNISRTKSTANMANNVGNVNNKQTASSIMKRQTGTNPIGRRLLKGKSLGGSATSLNSSNDCTSSSSSSSSSTISATNSSNDSLDNDQQTGESVTLNRRIIKSTVYNNNRHRRLSSGLTGTGVSTGQTSNFDKTNTSPALSNCSMSSSTSSKSMFSKQTDVAADQNQSSSQRQMMVWLKNKQQQQPLEHQNPAAKTNEARPVPTARTITGFCHDDGNNNIDNNDDNKDTMTAANPTSTIFINNTNHNSNPDPIIYHAHNNNSNDNDDDNHNIGNITHQKDNGTKQSSPGALVEVCTWLERSHLHRTAANAASP